MLKPLVSSWRYDLEKKICSLFTSLFPKCEDEILKIVWDSYILNGKQPDIFMEIFDKQGHAKRMFLNYKTINLEGYMVGYHGFYEYSVSSLFSFVDKRGYKFIYAVVQDNSENGFSNKISLVRKDHKYLSVNLKKIPVSTVYKLN